MWPTSIPFIVLTRLSYTYILYSHDAMRYDTVYALLNLVSIFQPGKTFLSFLFRAIIWKRRKKEKRVRSATSSQSRCGRSGERLAKYTRDDRSMMIPWLK